MSRCSGGQKSKRLRAGGWAVLLLEGPQASLASGGPRDLWLLTPMSACLFMAISFLCVCVFNQMDMSVCMCACVGMYVCVHVPVLRYSPK